MKRLTPALLSPLFLGLLFSGAASAAELTLVNFGGANGNAQKVAYVEPFQKSTGTKVVTAEFNGELAKLKAMVETKKVSWDVVEIDGGDLTRACDDGLIEKLDLAKTIKKDDY
ncbi:extracellular solute-binding protein, partial [Herbaspirillum huttiense]